MNNYLKLTHKPKYNVLVLVLVITALVLVGIYIIFKSHAATSNADFNGDGKVNITDLSILASHYGQTSMTHGQGDANGDGLVDINDLSILASQWGSTTTNSVTTYNRLPGSVPSSAYTLSVNGQPVFVEHFSDISYARFAYTGAANITVTATSQTISNFNISPKAYGISGNASGSTLSFSITKPNAKLVINIANSSGTVLEKLFIFADAPEVNAPILGNSGVTNIMNYVTDNTGATTQTTEIQNAINATSASNGGAGGTLYVPDGEYLTDPFNLKSNVNLYLQSGALIKSTTCDGAYGGGGQALVKINSATNVKITGRGAIQGGGAALFNNTGGCAGGSAGHHHEIIQPNGSSNVTVADIIIRDSDGFTVHSRNSSQVMLTNYKIINNLTISNQDGTDPDGGSGVTIDGIFAYTSDDAVSVKAQTSLSDNMVIQNCVFWTIKSALKVGNETASNVSNITFQNNDVVHADRALVIYNWKTANTIDTIKFLNNRSERIGDDSRQRLIDFDGTNTAGAGIVKNIYITDYTAYSFGANNSTIQGNSATGSTITNVQFKNLSIVGQVRLNAADAKIDIGANASNVTFSP